MFYWGIVMSDVGDLKEKARALFFGFLTTYNELKDKDSEGDILLQLVSECSRNDCETDVNTANILRSVLDPLVAWATVYNRKMRASKASVKFEFIDIPDSLTDQYKHLIELMKPLDASVIDNALKAPENFDLENIYTITPPSKSIGNRIDVYVTIRQGVVDVVASNYRELMTVTVLNADTEEPNTELDGVNYKATRYTPDCNAYVIDAITNSMFNIEDDYSPKTEV
jgi:hypothetical protein